MSDRDREPRTPAGRDPLERLDERIAEARKAHAPETASRGSSSNLGVALRISTEFVAAVIVGAGIGVLIDRGLGTGPWALLFFLLLGIAAAFVNLMRTAAELNARQKPPES